MDLTGPFLIPDMTRIIIPVVEDLDLIVKFPFRQICLKLKCIITCPTDSTVTVPVAMVSTIVVAQVTDSTSTVPEEMEVETGPVDSIIVPAEMEMEDTTAVPVEMDLVALPEVE